MPTPQEDFDALIDHLMVFAENVLKEFGEFFPFAAKIDASGELVHVSGYTGSERPEPTDLAAFLLDVLKDFAATGEIRAAGVCVDVRVAARDGSGTTDAVRLALEHRKADPVAVYVP